MNITDNALNVLAAKSYKGIGRAWLYKHLRGGESIEQLAGLINSHGKQPEMVTVDELQKVRAQIRQQLQKQADYMDGAIALGDAVFPQPRGQVKNSEQPVVLFYRGDLGLLSLESPNIAVIGLLQPDDSTVVREQAFVNALVQKGAVIVSGLALGCDSVGHRQALQAGGKTVAILPSTLDAILPSENAALAQQIVQHQGLLLTEYYLPTRSAMEQSGRYQERDRLQALFSDCVVLTASYAKNNNGLDSGSRLAMGYAQDYGIARALMYDPVLDADNPKFDLNRQLLQEQPGIIRLTGREGDSALQKIMEYAGASELSQAQPAAAQGSLF